MQAKLNQEISFDLMIELRDRRGWEISGWNSIAFFSEKMIKPINAVEHSSVPYSSNGRTSDL